MKKEPRTHKGHFHRKQKNPYHDIGFQLSYFYEDFIWYAFF